MKQIYLLFIGLFIIAISSNAQTLRGKIMIDDKIIVSSDEAKIRLDSYLQNKFKDFTRSNIKKHIDDGKITVNDNKVKAGYILRENKTFISFG